MRSSSKPAKVSRLSFESTPRSGKFSLLRELQELGGEFSVEQLSAARARQEAARQATSIETPAVRPECLYPTVQLLQERHEEQDAEDETNMMIRRHRYAQFIARMSAQRSRYHSTSVFIEAMLQELQQAPEADTATRAAAATWGLTLLARQSTSATLQTILTFLQPAVYCHFDPTTTLQAAPTVQLQVGSSEVVDDNPFFTHVMYVDEVRAERDAVSHLQRSLEQAVLANDRRRHLGVRLLRIQERSILQRVLRAWRWHVGQMNRMEMVGAMQMQNSDLRLAKVSLRAAFYQWKSWLEAARNVFLTDRLHDAAFQLENAKNQFQLQCYRADHLIETAKQATEELQRAKDDAQLLQSQIALLRKEMAEREAEYNRNLSRNVSSVMKVLHRYEQLADLLMNSRRPTEAYLAVAPSTADMGGPDITSNSYTNLDLSGAVGYVPGAEVGDEPTPNATTLLLQWCTSILTEVLGEGERGGGDEQQQQPIPPLTSFGADFVNGEYYLYILRYVFPGTISVAMSIKEMDLQSRLRRIRDCGEDCRLRYALVPSDFLNQRGDRIACSLSELYTLYTMRRWVEVATKSAEDVIGLREADDGTIGPLPQELPAKEHRGRDSSVRGSHSGVAVLVPPSPAPDEPLDEEKFKELLRTCLDRVAVIQRRFCDSAFYEAELAKSTSLISAEESRLVTARQQGLPVPLIGPAATRCFWQLPPRTLRLLLSDRRASGEAGALESMAELSLTDLLKECAELISCIFFFFAGENAKTISEIAFWRFVELSGMLMGDNAVEKESISRLYDGVVSPQLDTALKAAARNQSDMGVQKLRQVAYQEMDVRNASTTQFSELLVRIAHHISPPGTGVEEGVRQFIRRLTPPSRERFPSVIQELYTPESQSVLAFFSEDLLRIFSFYVKRQESSRDQQERAMSVQEGGRFAAQISVNTFLGLLEDCEVVGGTGRGLMAVPDAWQSTSVCTTPQAVRKFLPILERTYRDPYSNGSGLTFALFIDSIAVLAHHWCPDPLVPSSRRLAAFLAFMIHQLSTRHSSTTLLLGTPPSISLDGGKEVDFGFEARAEAGTFI